MLPSSSKIIMAHSAPLDKPKLHPHTPKLDKTHGTLGPLKLQLHVPKSDKAHHGAHG